MSLHYQPNFLSYQRIFGSKFANRQEASLQNALSVLGEKPLRPLR